MFTIYVVSLICSYDRKKIAVDASSKMQKAIQLKDLEIKSLLDATDERLDRLRAMVRLIILNLFAKPVAVVVQEHRRVKVIPSENYIRGVDGTIPALANYVFKNARTWRHVVNTDDLRDDLKGMESVRNLALYDARKLLVSEALLMLEASEQLYYQSGMKDWCVPQSFIDERKQLRRIASPKQASSNKRRTKNDTRPFHGRPGRDRSKGEPTSIGRSSCDQRQ